MSPARPPPKSVWNVSSKLRWMTVNASLKRSRVVLSMRLIASPVWAIESTRSLRCAGQERVALLELVELLDGHHVDGAEPRRSWPSARRWLPRPSARAPGGPGPSRPRHRPRGSGRVGRPGRGCAVRPRPLPRPRPLRRSSSSKMAVRVGHRACPCASNASTSTATSSMVISRVSAQRRREVRQVALGRGPRHVELARASRAPRRRPRARSVSRVSDGPGRTAAGSRRPRRRPARPRGRASSACCSSSRLPRPWTMASSSSRRLMMACSRSALLAGRCAARVRARRPAAAARRW